MTAATFIVGDVRQVLATFEPESVDLVLTSPPFLALRSYLPADHPDKPYEIGSETPETPTSPLSASDRYYSPSKPPPGPPG